MINLIKNEFIKIFKKKSTYIILLLTVAFIIFNNVMNLRTQNLYYSSGYDDELIQSYEQSIKAYSPDNPLEVSEYVAMKSKLDMMKLMQQYGFDSWQAYIIQTELGSDGLLLTLNRHQYLKNQVSEQEYTQAKQEYDKFIQKLDTDDWKYFASNQLQDIEKQILQEENSKNPIPETLHSLKTQKQILEWRLSKNISYEGSFLNSCLRDYETASQEVYQYEQQKNPSYEHQLQYQSNLEEMNTSKYYIENEIRNMKPNDNRDVLLKLSQNYELFILIFVIMIAGGVVSDEFNKGTIKLLLVRPYNRAKILFSKLIVCILMLLFIVVFIGITQFIVGGIILGFDSISVPAVIYNFNTNQVETMSILKYMTITTLAKSPIYILLITLAFACSTLFVNTAVSIVLPLLGYMGSSLINQLALGYNIDLLNYFVTPNWDLTPYLFGGISDFQGLTMLFSIIICAIYFMIMIVTMFITFKKRNIKNI